VLSAPRPSFFDPPSASVQSNGNSARHCFVFNFPAFNTALGERSQQRRQQQQQQQQRSATVFRMEYNIELKPGIDVSIRENSRYPAPDNVQLVVNYFRESTFPIKRAFQATSRLASSSMFSPFFPRNKPPEESKDSR